MVMRGRPGRRRQWCSKRFSCGRPAPLTSGVHSGSARLRVAKERRVLPGERGAFEAGRSGGHHGCAWRERGRRGRQPLGGAKAGGEGGSGEQAGPPSALALTAARCVGACRERAGARGAGRGAGQGRIGLETKGLGDGGCSKPRCKAAAKPRPVAAGRERRVGRRTRRCPPLLPPASPPPHGGRRRTLHWPQLERSPRPVPKPPAAHMEHPEAEGSVVWRVPP
jgi:hypothetical protein